MDRRQPQFYCRRTEPQDLRSGPDGTARLPWTWFQNPLTEAGTPVLAMHTERGLGATILIPRDSHDREWSVLLHPLCRVSFRLISSALLDMGFPLAQTKGHILVRQNDEIPLFEQLKTQAAPDGTPYEFEYLLPPGNYCTWFFGDADGRPETRQVRIAFDVVPGQESLDLGTIDLPPAQYSFFYGKPAPEFVQLKDIRTGRPVSLAAMRGKVVLVAFTPAYSCVKDKLQGLYERYKSAGLEVVLIHSPDTAPSALEGDPDRTQIIEAVDGGAPTGRHKPGSISGTTAAAYGLETGDVMFLIDHDGRMLQRIRLERPVTKNVLERALGLLDAEAMLLEADFNALRYVKHVDYIRLSGHAG